MEKVSVIVPIYNEGNYLADCLNSIINQTYRNLEIILVNNSSTDNSLAICQQFKERDSRIRVTCQPNLGAGGARNHGLALATGELIMFVDGDDSLTPDLIMNFYQKMKQDKVDIVNGCYYRLDSEGTYYFYSNEKQQFTSLERTYSTKEWLPMQGHSLLIRDIFFRANGVLFKRSLFDNIEYPEHSDAEDALTAWKLYLAANKIAFVNKAGYCWKIRPGSATSKQRSQTQLVKNTCTTLEAEANFYPLMGVDTNFLRGRYLFCLTKQLQCAEKDGQEDLKRDAQAKLAIVRKYHLGE